MSEFYTPMPDGYSIGQTKYVAVLGTVMSGLGKGIFSSSLGRVLKDCSYTVAPIKLEGYLNEDAGTLNPYRHGEVFVLDDGTECDMDLGTYERMLDMDLSKKNFTTSGQILRSVFDKERKGEYLGRDVQIIPHVTGEIKLRLRELALESKADVVLIEVGGTVGDLENSHYIEALRELAYEEGPNSVCFVALTFIMEPPALREQKSKAAQLGINALVSKGIQPDLIVCRADREVTQSIKEKIAVYSSVPVDNVFSMHDVPDIYQIPVMLAEARVHRTVLDKLGLPAMVVLDSPPFRKLFSEQKTDNIGIVGKYASLRDSYASIIQALKHVEFATGIVSNLVWIDTSDLISIPDDIAKSFQHLDGIIIPGGFGPRGMEGKIVCIKYARENNIPCLGLCYGFQAMVIEFARSINIISANTTEISETCPHPVIDLLPEQKEVSCKGATMRLGSYTVQLKDGSKAKELHEATETVLRFRHRYEVNPNYVEILEKAGLRFSGRNIDGSVMQILELPDHPFFMGTQAHPEFRSRPLKPDPFFMEFVKASLARTRTKPI